MLIIIALHYFLSIVLSGYYTFLVWPQAQIASELNSLIINGQNEDSFFRIYMNSFQMIDNA